MNAVAELQAGKPAPRCIQDSDADPSPKGLRSKIQHDANTAAPPLGKSWSVSTLESACNSEVRTNSDTVILALCAHDDANMVSAELAPFPGQAGSVNGKLHESRCLKCFFQLRQDLEQITQVRSLYVLKVKSEHWAPEKTA